MHIQTFTFDGVWYNGPESQVVDAKGNAVYGPKVLFGVLRCHIWGLLHGHGWLPVVKSA